MSPRFFLHVIFLRKWFILSAFILTPILTLVFLLFTEPVFNSKCKLQVVDRQDERDPTRVMKPTQKDDTFIQAQIDLIYTDSLMGKVVDKAGLFPAPPKQSPFAKSFAAKWFPPSQPGSEFSPERQRIETIRNVKKLIKVDAISPVIMNITTSMNTPELAQTTAKAVYDSYIEEFGRLQKESGEMRKVFEERLRSIQLLIDDAQAELRHFHAENPPTGVPTAVPDLSVKPKLIDTPPSNGEANTNPSFMPGARELNPLQKINQEKAALELELIKLRASNSDDSFLVKRVLEQIDRYNKLAESYKSDLAKQNVMALKERELNWRLESLHASYNSIKGDFERAEGTQLIKELGKGTIMVLDPPTFDPQSVFPKRTIIMIAAIFGGLVLGLAMAYIAHVLDSTYHLPEDFSADTGIPVLAAIPAR